MTNPSRRFDPKRLGLIKTGALATSVAVVLVVIVHLIARGSGDDLVVVRLVVMILTGVAVYGMGVLWIGGPVRAEIQEVVGWVVHKGQIVVNPE